MSLQALLRDVEPGWYALPGHDDGAPLDPALLVRAHASAIGRRMLARWLAAGTAPALLAPRPGGGSAAAVARWPRARLAALIRDLGVLAFAPAIRSEVRREPVRILKHTLGNGYLLALDNAVWDARVDGKLSTALSRALDAAVAIAKKTEQPDAIHALLDLQGRSELCRWAAPRDAALADWVTLQFPRETRAAAHLPETQLQFLHAHHQSRAAGTG